MKRSLINLLKRNYFAFGIHTPMWVLAMDFASEVGLETKLSHQFLTP